MQPVATLAGGDEWLKRTVKACIADLQVLSRLLRVREE
jgi:hypothetical protein